MKIERTYVTCPAIIQLLIFLLFLLAGTVLPFIVSTGLLLMIHGLQADVTQGANLTRFIQFIPTTCIFLLPPIAMAWMCSDNPHHYLLVKKVIDGRIWIPTLVCVFLLSPVISLLGLSNKQVELPALMASVEEWMWTQETLAEQLTATLLSNDSAWVILTNFIVIATAAGITEEFLLRGALQRVIGRQTSNPHTIIWVVAILFSAFHLQFYGFLPRMILGVYSGYLLYWSKSIRIPMFAHFVNSVFAVIGVSDSRLKDNEFIMGDTPAEHLLDSCLITTSSFLLFILVNKRLKRLL